MNNDDERDSAEEAFNEALLHDEEPEEPEETWDTGEVRLTIANDPVLYAATRDHVQLEECITRHSLFRIWNEHRPAYCTADPERVAWGQLAAELTQEWAAEEASAGIVRVEQDLTPTGLRLGYTRDEGESLWSLDLLGHPGGPSPLLGITEADGQLHIFHWPDGEEAVTLVRLDTASSASRQHFIDTGSYLAVDDA